MIALSVLPLGQVYGRAGGAKIALGAQDAILKRFLNVFFGFGVQDGKLMQFLTDFGSNWGPKSTPKS